MENDITHMLINALSAMTAAFIGAVIGLFCFWDLGHEALDLARKAAEQTEQAEYELKRAQEQYERDMHNVSEALYTCERQTWDIKAHCPLYVAP